MKRIVRHLSSRLVATSMKQRLWAACRKRVLASASGDILEIGFGSGANLGFYPQDIQRITAIDTDPLFTRLARKSIRNSPIQLQLHYASAEALPFENEAFDTVVSTLTLCSVSDPARCLSEVKRVLKPGGKLLFMEHGLTDAPHIQKWQHRLTGISKAIACGCHLNRDISEIFKQAGFRALHFTEDYIPKTPKFIGLLTEGIAEK